MGKRASVHQDLPLLPLPLPRPLPLPLGPLLQHMDGSIKACSTTPGCVRVFVHGVRARVTESIYSFPSCTLILGLQLFFVCFYTHEQAKYEVHG